MEQPEQQVLQIPPIQQVEPFPQDNVEVHEIHSDLDEENNPSTCPMDFFTSMTSASITTQLAIAFLVHCFPNILSLR